MSRFILFLLLALLPVSAASADPAEEARKGFATQRAAWNRGDIEAALDLYWNSADLTWAGADGVTKGFDAFAYGLRRDFAGGPTQMGVYTGTVLEARTLAPDTALLVVDWKIERDGRRLMGGVSTEIWKNVDGKWRIVFEHAS